MIPKELDQKKHCVWMEAGVIDYKICDNNYDCNTCKFDRSMKQTADSKSRPPESRPDTTGQKG